MSCSAVLLLFKGVPCRLTGLCLLLVALLCLVLSPEQARAELEVRSAFLLDMGTGKVLYEQNADEPIQPASLTKVLTMLLAFEDAAKGKAQLDAPVKVSRPAARTGGSRMALRPFEMVPLERLLLGMAVSSGNDATAAVAEYLGGSQTIFVERMNAKARAIGMRDSNFRNPHGLPADDQVTTARDMATLSYYYLHNYPTALRFHATRYMRHNGVVTYNKNPLLSNYDGADGLKTGWVRASGYNLISTVERGGTRLLAVVMGAENSNLRGRETHRLIEAGFMAAKDPRLTVATAIPGLNPADFAINVNKTAREAYAVLAPEVLGKGAAKKSSVKKQKSGKVRKNTQQAGKKRKQVQQARKRGKTDTHAVTRKSRQTQAASLVRRNS